MKKKWEYGMEEKMRKKTLRKAYRRQKRRLVLPWKLPSILLAVLLAVLAGGEVMVTTFDNTFAAYMGDTFWEVRDADSGAQYYKSDFASAEEACAYGEALCSEVEAEGAVLLWNENKALPLAEGSKVSCLSTSSVNLVYGGTGSGNVDASEADTLKEALETAGFEVNPTLWDFYTEGKGKKYLRAVGGMVTTKSAVVSEAPWNLYTEEVLSTVKTYGDAMIIPLSRVGGEGADLEYQRVNYLALDENEKDLLAGAAAMKERGEVRKIILLINSANPLQMDFMKGNPYGIDAILWIGDVGISGIRAVGEILSGAVNPSGSLADTYCYDNYAAPSMKNFTPVTYAGSDLKEITKNARTYMIYREGIYVGYKYFETRFEDVILGREGAGAFSYEEEVAFPFGYGLSYTDFAYSDLKIRYDAGRDVIEVRVSVTNTGAHSGKEPVQIYVQTPYTAYDEEMGIEKASVQLAGFGKTKELAPGEKQTLVIEIDRADLAVYDAFGEGTYILEAGDYYLTAAEDAHAAVCSILLAKGVKNVDGDAELTVKWTENETDTETYAVSKSGAEIQNRLSMADPNRNPSVREAVVWVSRRDWSGTLAQESPVLTLTPELMEDLKEVHYSPSDLSGTEMPVLGAENGLKLLDLRGLSFEDPKWDALLEQLTFEEMVSLIGDAFHWTMPVPSVQAPGTRDENGPQGLTASLLASDSTELSATAFTSEDVMAATFNTELIHEVGRVIGNNCLDASVALLYGPGNNIHRTPYGGRNFEYYSEDGFLSGKMSAAEVRGIESKGVHVCMKHFALNDCEQDRIGLGVWLTEQAAREIYLKAFQDAFEEGGAGGVMTAYTRWGTCWSGSNEGLMQKILREEWGCSGINITDNILTSYCNGVDALTAGGVTLFDAMLPYITRQLPEYRDDPVVVSAMQRACHYDLYAILHSAGMNGIGEDTVILPKELDLLKKIRRIRNLALAAFGLFAVLWIRGGRKLRRTEAFRAYRAYKQQKKCADK